MDPEKTMTTIEQDEILAWENFLQGSETSFEYLHQKYYNDLYAYALKMCRDEYVAKNAIQDLFVYLWKNKANLSRVQHVRYYLIFSLRRHTIRLLKKEKKHVHLALKNEDDTYPLTFSPEDIQIIRENAFINKKCVIEALNQLPSRQKEIVYLRYYQDLNIDEIAQILSVNYQSVLNALGRAMKNLRKLILSQKSMEIFLYILIPTVLLRLL